MITTPPQPFTRLHEVARVDSTTTLLTELVSADPAGWPHLSAVLARHQSAGRGRGGRGWHTPPQGALTASLVLRPDVDRHHWGWVPLIGALAVVRALDGQAPADGPPVALKWPNDVLLAPAGAGLLPGWGKWRKVAGLLATALPGDAAPGQAHRESAAGAALALGIGVNIAQRSEDLPVPWATSLAAAGMPAVPARELLLAIGGQLAAAVRQWQRHGGDAEAAGIAEAVRARCATLGQHVRVDLPGGGVLTGQARGIAADGRLLLATADGERAVSAGDVSHLRAGG